MRKALLHILIPTLTIITVLLQSCTNNQLVGKTYYLINGHISNNYYASLKEVKVTFISSDKIESSVILYADALGYCIEDTSITKIGSYKYKDGILELPGFTLLIKLEFLDNGDIRTNEGEVFYQTSIVGLLGTKDAYERINRDPKGNKIDIFNGFLDKPCKPIIRKRGDELIISDLPTERSAKRHTQQQQRQPKAIFKGANREE
jgi:hypothetical protein